MQQLYDWRLASLQCLSSKLKKKNSHIALVLSRFLHQERNKFFSYLQLPGGGSLFLQEYLLAFLRNLF